MIWFSKRQPFLPTLLLLLTSIQSHTADQAAQCPFSCTCRDTLVSCRGGKLTSLPLTFAKPGAITDMVISGQRGLTRVGGELQLYPALRVLNLSSNNISVIEVGAFSNLSLLSTLILRRNFITRLNRKMFQGLENLQNLDLGYNGLTALHKNAFLDLMKLRKLDFTKNNISIIDKDSFKGLKSLVVLNLTSNRLKRLDSFTFSNLRSLEILVLDDNQIEELPRFVFTGLPSLKILRLSGNRLSKLHPLSFALDSHTVSPVEQLYLKGTNLTDFPTKAFEQLHHLEILDFSQSKIKTLQNGSFSKLINLRKLTIAGLDNLTEIENHTFTWLFKLKELIVSRNPLLETLGSEAMPSFQGNLHIADFSFNSIKVFHKGMVAWDSDVIVDLSHNAIVCDCRAVWMLHWLPKAGNIKTRRMSHNLTCAAPQKLKGRRILSLPSSAFNCDKTKLGSIDANKRVKTAAIAAVVTSVLLITTLILVKFRNRWLSFCRRQYRYRSYKNHTMFTVDKNANSSEERVAMDVSYTYVDEKT